MEFVILTDDNYILFAMKHYNNPQCVSYQEFEEDMNRVKYLKRLLRKYKSTGILRERLILNHIIILYNMFGIEATSRLLFSRIEEELHPYLKPFIVYLNYLPSSIPECDIVTIPMDLRIIHQLRKIK